MNFPTTRAAVLVNWQVREEFRLAIELTSQLGWSVRTIGGPFPRRITRLSKYLIAWPCYLLVPLRALVSLRRLDVIIAWQQVYGLVLALLIRVLGIPTDVRICILSFIVVPGKQQGLFRRLIEYALECRNVTAAVCYNEAEARLYAKVFPSVVDKIRTATLAEDIDRVDRFRIRDAGYFLAAGRSNRDYRFLLEFFRSRPDLELHVVTDQFPSQEPLPPNIKVLDKTFGDDYLDEIAACHAIVLSFEDETISSGQLVFLHALQLEKPVIATRSHCLDGYLIDGTNGLEIDKSCDAMSRAIAYLDAPGNYRLMVRSGQSDYQARFGFRQLARRFGEIYDGAEYVRSADCREVNVRNSESRDISQKIAAAVIEPVGSHGGMDYYDCGLCRGLGNAGVDVTWYTCDISETRGYGPINIAHTFRRVWGKDAAWRRGFRYGAGLLRSVVDAKRRGAAVAHFHFFHVGILELLGVLMAKLARLRVVATVHDVEAFAPGRKSRSLRDLTYSLCDRFVVHNLVSRDELVKHHGVPSGKVRVIAHGSYLDLVTRLPDRMKARSQLGLSDAGRVVLFFGQIKEVKGLDLLIEAFGRVRDQLGVATLVIAGKVWKDDFSRYQSLIDKHGLAENCRLYIRYIPDEQVAGYYAAADIVVLPYRRIYQSGVLLMAMSLGTPVLASDLPGMTEIIRDGSNGFLFRAGDVDDLALKLVAALNDCATLQCVADTALQEMATSFSWNTIGNHTAAMYGELISGGAQT